MKRIIIGAVLLLTTAVTAFSQTRSITVSGRVMEDDTKQPAMQATVQLLSLPDSAQAAGVASSNQGYFKLPKVKPGKFCNACSLKELCLPKLWKKRSVQSYLRNTMEDVP